MTAFGLQLPLSSCKAKLKAKANANATATAIATANGNGNGNANAINVSICDSCTMEVVQEQVKAEAAVVAKGGTRTLAMGMARLGTACGFGFVHS